MNILVVDDHPVVTVSLSERLKTLGHAVQVANDLDEAGRRIRGQRFELCVLDLNMGGRRGTDLLVDPALAGLLPGCVVILSGTGDRDEIVGALDDGAHAFLPKSIPFDDVIDGLLAAPKASYGGEPGVWVQEVRAYLPLGVVFPRGTTLSRREREVLSLLRHGLSDKAIAQELNRSVHTIRVQIRSILRKRGSARRRENSK